MNDTLHDPSWLICHDDDDHDAVHATAISPMTSSSTCGDAIHASLASSLASSLSSSLASSSSSSWDIPFLGGRYVVHPPDVDVVLHMMLGLIFQLFVGFIFAFVAYATVLPSRHGGGGRSLGSSGEGGKGVVDDGAMDDDLRDDVDARDGGGGRGRRTRTTTMMMIRTTMEETTRLVIGSTLVLSSIVSPYLLISTLRIRNSASRFAICSSFVLYLFRALEAMFDYAPIGATSTLRVYAAYFALPFDMAFDATTNRPILATWDDVRDGMMRVLRDASIMTLLCSVLSTCDYMPFGSYDVRHDVVDDDDHHDRHDHHQPLLRILGLFHWKHLGDCLVIAYFFQQGLSLSFSIYGNVIQCTLGYKSPSMMRSPILEASSPSDFWGRRWNVLVHSAMKRGVYEPMRHMTNSSILASLAVFVTSGAFHEWLVHACFIYDKNENNDSFYGNYGGGGVRIGSQTAFFVWNFVVIAIERFLVKNEIFANYARRVPRSLVPSLIVMTSLPVAHWFRDPYMYGGFFRDYEMCLAMMRRKAMTT